MDYMEKIMKTLAMILVAVSLYATTGYYTGSSSSYGTKICFYKTTQGTMTINIGSHQVCHMTVEF